jgi:PAS domain S-box-containing protein
MNAIDPIYEALQVMPCASVVASTGLGGEILHVNAEFTAVTGYTIEDIPTVLDWVERAYPDPEYRAQVLANWDKDVTDVKRDVVYQVTCSDGAVREMLLRASLLAGERMIVMALDLTEHRRVERQLLESEERYRNLVDTLPSGIVVHAEGKAVFVNEATCRALGVEGSEELLGRGVLEFVHAEDRARASRRIQSLYDKDAAADWREYRFVREDGGEFDVELVATSSSWRGEPAAQVVFNDISARKRREHERRRLEARVQQAQKMESLGVLAGGVAHDFNNLLVGILGNADLALMKLPPEAAVRPHLQDIEQASMRAADLARQMLAYSGKGRFVVEELDLRLLVEEIAHLLEVSISKKAVLKYDFGLEVPPISADATQVRQVIMNLITNASEALQDGSGVISISTGSMVCDEDYLGGTFIDQDLAPGTYTFMEVSDTGVGMDEQARERVFDPFFTTKFTGRGLGLAAVLGIVRGHSGAIKVYSEPGKGTTMKVLFPSTLSDDAGGGATETVEIEWVGSGLVLLVDDEESVRAVGASMLQHAGFDVITAGDGEEAVELFRRRRDDVDCVLLDLAMPGLDGVETFRELRRFRADVQVVLTSGYSEQEAVNRFSGKKLAGFVQKPFRLAELMDTLKQAMER